MAKLFIENLSLEGKRVLVRVDFNVPLAGDPPRRTVKDDTRIRAALPTIRHILANGGKPVLMSHLGRPKNGVDPAFSMAPVAQSLSMLADTSVILTDSCVGAEVSRTVNDTAFGKIVLLENTRFHPEEKANDPVFAASLASLGDVYINDAFGTAHRAEASTEGVTHFIPSCAMGYLIEKEVRFLKGALDNPERPFVAILGGAKVSDKIALIDSLLPRVDELLIGGGMAYTFLKSQGISIGNSLFEEDRMVMAQDLLARSEGKIRLPVDHVVANRFAEDADFKTQYGRIDDDWMGLDIGPETRADYSDRIKAARTIIWNGPMGVFEMERFRAGTMQIAHTLADHTASGATTIVGGGDSVAAVVEAGVTERISHVSTGGGAMLTLLEGHELPGIAALSDV